MLYYIVLVVGLPERGERIGGPVEGREFGVLKQVEEGGRVQEHLHHGTYNHGTYIRW